MFKRLKKAFFKRPTLKVCRDILGKYLVHKVGGKKLVGKIVEVEAYVGSKDRASHALGGKKTKRNRAEFLEGGHVYIYLVYGMYWQFNISTGNKGFPECFLIRALEPVTIRHSERSEESRGSEATRAGRHCVPPARFFGLRPQNDIIRVANGPGKLCKWMGLNKKHYGLDLAKSQELWIEDRGEKVLNSQIVRAKRIGIDYAGKYWAGRLWRFYIKGNSCVSRF